MNEVLKAYKKWDKYDLKSLFTNIETKKRLALELQSVCVSKPGEVVEIALDTSLCKPLREKILFTYSSDHWGSSDPNDNPRWGVMLKDHIIPRLGEFPPSTRRQIVWYIKQYQGAGWDLPLWTKKLNEID